MKLKGIIVEWLKQTEEDAKQNDYYSPKLFGESKSVEFECDGLASVHCKTTKWANGEGYDVSFDTDKQETKTISLHEDEIESFLACLNYFKYFG